MHGDPRRNPQRSTEKPTEMHRGPENFDSSKKSNIKVADSSKFFFHGVVSNTPKTRGAYCRYKWRHGSCDSMYGTWHRFFDTGFSNPCLHDGKWHGFQTRVFRILSSCKETSTAFWHGFCKTVWSNLNISANKPVSCACHGQFLAWLLYVFHIGAGLLQTWVPEGWICGCIVPLLCLSRPDCFVRVLMFYLHGWKPSSLKVYIK